MTTTLFTLAHIITSMATRYFNLIGSIMLGLLSAAAQVQQPSGEIEEPAVQILLQIARQSGTAVGIVQLHDGSLCRSFTKPAANSFSNVQKAFGETAAKAGYRLVELDGTYVIEPLEMPSKLREALNYGFPRFPQVTDTVHYMGLLLQGWLSVAVDGDSGFVIESASSNALEEMTLPESGSTTTHEIASRIANLGSKGAWILTLDTQEIPIKREVAKIRVYSYKDNIRELDAVGCNQLPAK